MNNNYKIVRTIYENVFQRVLECKDNDSGDIFYSNIITSQKVINLINIEDLKKLSSNIIECYNTEDRIYIFTKPLKDERKSIKEFVNSKLTIKQQFSLSKKIIELASDIYNMTDVVQQKILDLDRVYIDNNNEVIVDCNLIFEDEYDISDNETFKRLGNIIHFIFAGSEIVDYNISEIIPPDILKIIVRCLTREYMFPKDTLEELVRSPIYNMIFSNKKTLSNDTEIYLTDKNAKQLNQDLNIKEDSTDTKIDLEEKTDESVLDIYLNSNDSNDIDNVDIEKKDNIKKTSFKLNKDVKRAIVSILLVVLVLLVGNSLMKKTKDSEETSGGTSEANQQENKDNKDNNENEENDTNQEDSNEESNANVTEKKYLNDELLNNIGYQGEIAKEDNEIFVEGPSSLVIKNDVDEKVKVLFAAVDFTDEDFSYMLKRQIGVSAKTKSEMDVSALIVLEAYKDGNLASNFHTKIDIYDDLWSQNTVPINVTNADSLNIYLEYEGINKVWIDSIYIDVIK
ncbi:hypothetical protein [Sedimentibacter sp. MB31-C6]|uniref:hypothetical protein n=1 Tax=Sedimentibacter sp. MB31-C6 TaxID=3109366 RepID=UPI002DDD399B|nr:hypothetical protein [Sedimentibacter sp. MB36-C1]WSI04398.1 hypothetical protein U8307_01060 [Sedimentibacter sp. MB36-C1]